MKLIPSYSVRLGDGHNKMTRGHFKDVEVKLENHTIKETFFLFELGGVDLILRVEWLATLGDVKAMKPRYRHGHGHEYNTDTWIWLN